MLFAVAAGVGVLLAFLGPFGSYGAPLPDRLVFWIASVIAGTGLSALTTLLLPIRWRGHSGPVYVLTATALVTPLQTLVVQLLLPMIAPPQIVSEISFWQNLPNVAVLVLIGTSAAWVFQTRPTVAPVVPVQSAPTAPETTPFFARLPHALGTQVLCLEMEDHYLRVHTSLGNALILMRLRDAVAELRAVPGMQVHKSWWVARAALAGAERGKSGWELILTDGRRVPVGRTYRPTLVAEGWLPGGRKGDETGHGSEVPDPLENPSASSGNARISS
jgi:hypothetical protein